MYQKIEEDWKEEKAKFEKQNIKEGMCKYAMDYMVGSSCQILVVKSYSTI